jgi:hypothetical protein
VIARLTRTLLVAAVAVVSLFSSTAGADEPRRLAWPKKYPKFHPVEYVATGAMVIAAAYIELGVKTTTDEPKWTGPILFDESMRVKNKSFRNSQPLDWVSDATLYIPQAGAIIFDPAVPLLKGEYETAWQMSMINAEAFGIVEILTRYPIKTAGRERPDAYECRTSDPNYSVKCNRGPFASFPSGHTSFAFTVAALTCSHHAALNLYGNKFADWTACVASMAMATSTALTRTLMDRHWFSDVFTGVAIGLGAGFGVPFLLHYKSPFYKTETMRATVVPGGVGTGVGGNLLGWF